MSMETKTAEEMLNEYIPEPVRENSTDDEIIVPYPDALAAVRRYHAQFRSAPLPTDIQKWIEDEAKKYVDKNLPYSGEDVHIDLWQSGASTMYNLLSPQIELWKKAYGERNKEYLEQQKEIERLKNHLEDLYNALNNL